MKVTSSDLLAILRRFNIANDDDLPRHIDQIKIAHPSPINLLVSFRFNRQRFFVLFDETAEDNIQYIMQQIFTMKSDAEGTIIENPISQLSTYGLPFKGKDAYLFQIVNRRRRLDAVLAERYPERSRSTWQKYIKFGNILINNSTATSPKQLVSEADNIQINLPKSVDHSERTMPILYLDDDVIVINKPSGILTHSKGTLNNEFTVADFFRRYSNVALDTNRPGIVHRLDRDTSGVLIGARTPEAFSRLKAQFSERKAQKYYLAIVDGTPKQTSAKIDIPLGRNPAHPSIWRPDIKGKPAQTIYHTLASHNNKSLLLLHPQTGRTHQLRVHLQYLGTPIYGDRVYGKVANRMYLHALKLEITIHAEDRRTFIAPIPDEFRRLFPEVDDAVANI